MGKLLLNLAADGHHTAALRLGNLQYLAIEGVLVQIPRKISFAEVGNIDDRLIGKQRTIGDQLLFLLGAGEVAGRFALAQPLIQPLKQCGFRQRLFIAALCRLFAAVNAALHQVDIGKHQLQIDGLDIPCGADLTADMDNLTVIEAAHHMDNGVNLTDMRKKLVAQPLALRSALDQPCNVHKLDDCRGHLIGRIHLAQLIQSGVRHRHDSDIRLDGAEWIVGCACAAAGKGVEYSALADVRQADDT